VHLNQQGKKFLIHEFLDEQDDKIMIIKDGKNYEQITFQFNHYSKSSGEQMSSYNLGHKGVMPLTSFYNGYLSEYGDTLTASWKIIRTVQ